MKRVGLSAYPDELLEAFHAARIGESRIISHSGIRRNLAAKKDEIPSAPHISLALSRKPSVPCSPRRERPSTDIRESATGAPHLIALSIGWRLLAPRGRLKAKELAEFLHGIRRDLSLLRGRRGGLVSPLPSTATTLTTARHKSAIMSFSCRGVAFQCKNGLFPLDFAKS